MGCCWQFQSRWVAWLEGSLYPSGTMPKSWFSSALALGLWGRLSGCKGSCSGPCYLLISGGWKGRLIFFLSLALQWLCSEVWAGWDLLGTELVVLSPDHSHPGISTLVNASAVLRKLCLYLFLRTLNVAGSNVKYVNKFVPHPATPPPPKKCLEWKIA